MNTRLYVWLNPLVGGKYTDEYFYLTVEGDRTGDDLKELEDEFLGWKKDGDYLEVMMDMVGASSNNDYAVRSAKLTDNEVGLVEYALSPKAQKAKKKKEKVDKNVALVLAGDKDLKVTKSNLTATDKGKVKVKLSEVGIKEEFDFPTFWAMLQLSPMIKNIKKGDRLTITNDFGETVLDVRGGNFLSLAGADIGVYDTDVNPNSIFSREAGLKGALYIRDDGRLEIGNKERTFYVSINMSALMKSNLKTGLSLTDGGAKFLESTEVKTDEIEEDE